MIRHPAQGLALTPPAGWQVDQELTQRYHQMQQKWLVLAPIRRDPQAGMQITVHSAVADPANYPGRRGTRQDRELLPDTQGTGPLIGRRSSGRRADGRPFIVGTQDGLVTLHDRLALPLPWAGVLSAGGALAGPAARRRGRGCRLAGRPAGGTAPGRDRPTDYQRAARRAPPAEELGLFAKPLKTLASGGQGDYVWKASGGRWSAPQEGYWVEIHFPKFKGTGSSLGDVPGDLTATVLCVPHRAGVVYGAGPQTVVTVRVELAGRPAVTVPTAGRDKNLPFPVWVLAQLPLDVQVRAVIGLDATGRQVGRPAKPDGVRGAVCRA